MAGSRFSRRTFWVGLAAGAGALYLARDPLGDLFGSDLEFEPYPGLPGFRRMAGGSQSTAGSPGGSFSLFVGLEAPGEADPEFEGVLASVRSNVCAALYPEQGPSDMVPVASFSDYNCPYCRVQTEKLAEIAKNGGIAVAWHELPLLGDASVTAARGALAAKRQDAYLAFHRRLMRAPFQTDRTYLGLLAREIGVDEAEFIADMDSAAVADEIRRSRALSRIFGFVGTPALVVGRTVVQGEIGSATMRRLIERERADGTIPGCLS
ncbi:DsbA family protein [Palleronia aestuarii]|nr:DsbA family protein [Palleronia aestuarii]